jgi:hypothetical protein
MLSDLPVVRLVKTPVLSIELETRRTYLKVDPLPAQKISAVFKVLVVEDNIHDVFAGCSRGATP